MMQLGFNMLQLFCHGVSCEGKECPTATSWQELVAIKFEDNQAKGNPNQLKTEYAPWPRFGGEQWLH